MGELLGQMLYFAYGADMRREALARRCSGAECLGLARLEDHRFVIGPHGLANVQSRRGEMVWGTLWLVPAGELPALDVFAGAGDGRCERTTRRIVSPAGPRTEAMIYLTEQAGVGEASAEYLAEVLTGAREGKLPATYLTELATWSKKERLAPAGTGEKDSR